MFSLINLEVEVNYFSTFSKNRFWCLMSVCSRFRFAPLTFDSNNSPIMLMQQTDL